MIGMSKNQYALIRSCALVLQDDHPEAVNRDVLKEALEVLTDICNLADDEMSNMPHSWFKTSEGKAALEWAITVEAAVDQVIKELGLKVSVEPQPQPEYPAYDHLLGLFQTPRGF